jgi:hypothetical protein
VANGFHTAHEVTETIPHDFGEVTERLRCTAAPLNRTPAPNAPLTPWPAGAPTSNKPWWEGANGAPVATYPAASFAGSGQAGIRRPGQGSAPSGSGGIEPRTLWPGRAAFRIPQPHPVPDEIQKSFLLWMSVAALTVLGLLVNLILAAVSGTAFDGSAIIDLLIGALLAFGAAHTSGWAIPGPAP